MNCAPQYCCMERRLGIQIQRSTRECSTAVHKLDVATHHKSSKPHRPGRNRGKINMRAGKNGSTVRGKDQELK